MCLFISKRKTSDFRYKTKDGKHRIYVYKKLYYVRKGFLSPYKRIPYHFGWNKADRIVIKDNKVFNSIHVYKKNLSKDTRYSLWEYDREVILKCWAYRKDIVSVGNTDMAFKKIFIPKKEWTRIIDAIETNTSSLYFN